MLRIVSHATHSQPCYADSKYLLVLLKKNFAFKFQWPSKLMPFCFTTTRTSCAQSQRLGRHAGQRSQRLGRHAGQRSQRLGRYATIAVFKIKKLVLSPLNIFKSRNRLYLFLRGPAKYLFLPEKRVKNCDTLSL